MILKKYGEFYENNFKCLTVKDTVAYFRFIKGLKNNNFNNVIFAIQNT
jgi:hypothetical protein